MEYRIEFLISMMIMGAALCVDALLQRVTWHPLGPPSSSSASSPDRKADPFVRGVFTFRRVPHSFERRSQRWRKNAELELGDPRDGHRRKRDGAELDLGGSRAGHPRAGYPRDGGCRATSGSVWMMVTNNTSWKQ